MNELLKFLSENPVQYLATVGPDGKPRNRPFQFALEQDGRLYYSTSNKKEVYKQLQANPYVEVTACAADYSWLRLSGKAVFDASREIKSRIIEAIPLVKQTYQSPDNPVFEAFYIDGGKAVIADFSGNPPREYTL